MLVRLAGGEDLFPWQVDFESVGVAGVVVPALVEGQEPGGIARQFCGELHFVVVDSEVGRAAAEPEHGLVGVAVPFVLFDRVGGRLFGEAAFELEGGDRQPVDEEAEVERELGVVAAVVELPGHAEAVLLVEPVGCGVVRGGAAVEEVEAVFAVVVAGIAGEPACAGSQGWPVSAVQMRRSRPASEVSVVMVWGPIRSGRRVGAAFRRCSGKGR